MNVYDFDKTIFKKDSTVSFYLYEIKMHPFLLRYLLIQGWYFLLYIFNFIDKTKFKQGFFRFLRGIKDINKDTSSFWANNKKNIKKWYLENKKDDDVIISASPFFLLQPICNSLGINNLVASKVDEKTGVFSGQNCYGDEKVRRFRETFPNQTIDCFYSDSLSDAPLAKISEQSFIVKDDNLVEWSDYHPSLIRKVKHLFLAPDFLAFLIVGGINAINGVLFSSLFSLIADVNLAFVFGYLCSLVISYFLNTFLVFKNKLHFFRFIKFVISYIPNFAIQFGLVYLFYNVLGINKILVYTIAVLIAIPITFVLLKLFAFSKNRLIKKNDSKASPN